MATTATAKQQHLVNTYSDRCMGFVARAIHAQGRTREGLRSMAIEYAMRVEEIDQRRAKQLLDAIRESRIES